MTTALLLSGGNGTRLGSEIPKQYIKVNNKPIILYSIETLDKCDLIDGIQIVAQEVWHADIMNWLRTNNLDRKFKGFSLPGETRQLSIFNALNDIKKNTKLEDYVFIHDAARPNLSEKTIYESIKKMEDFDGVIPVLPMKDTVYVSDDGKSISKLIDRSTIFAGQAPETFIYGKYLKANEVLLPEKIKVINGSTEPAIMADMNIAMIAGDENNYKITTLQDLERFKRGMENESLDFK